MNDSQPLSDADTIRLVLSQGHTGSRTLDLRVSPEGADELRRLMEEHSVFEGQALEFSAGSDLVIYSGSIATGLTALAAVIRAFVYQNRYKSIALSHGDEKIELKGLSKKESDNAIDRLLSDAHLRQLEFDAKWRRYRGRQEDEESENS